MSEVIRPILTVPRAHNAPVHVCTVDPTSTYVASGSADGVVKVWDLLSGKVTHVFTGHGGTVSALTFNYPNIRSAVSTRRDMQLVTASADTRLRIFSLSSGSTTPVAVLDGHHSVPRGLDVTSDGKWLISGGRDSMIFVWDLTPHASKALQDTSSKKRKKASMPTLIRNIPVLERIEALGFLWSDEQDSEDDTNSENMQFYTAGESGLIKVWDAKSGSLVFTLNAEDDRGSTEREIVNAVYVSSLLGCLRSFHFYPFSQLFTLIDNHHLPPRGSKHILPFCSRPTPITTTRRLQQRSG